MSYPAGAEPLTDPLEDMPDVPPTDPREPEGLETDIPADADPEAEEHPAEWAEEFGGEG